VNGGGEEAERLARGVASELRHDLTRRFGFTHLDLTFRADESRRELDVRGSVLVPRQRALLLRRLGAALPGWRLEPRLSPIAGAGWFALGGSIIALWRELPGFGSPRSRSTEMLAGDGPVELLVDRSATRLVRCMDGTVGWIDEPLGEAARMPTIGPAHADPVRLGASLRGFLDAPYVLGGTTPAGVDCTGLSQRAFRTALRLLLPRHSTDQLEWSGHPERPLGRTGDLVFTWTERDGPCHVGVVLESHEPRVVHASLSRARVVEEPLTAFVAGASRVAHATIEALLARHAESRGKCRLELPEPGVGG
jgi:hypothetical protein